ncbi:hypothetical protein EIN_508720 [Entamoeba invadens IP1]|uniref:Uncharacterized protein n=1 Tax=Entamoeba invadens IP1 TaxID=370355 RepID=A0A0A1UFQ8_ENTIV|nr:hypothetical protein EIN_508720 [Entamoeba invadens IP1]ELP92871.1 hypothetical protein EIN_508720 [Entamoeba invadens IP1]|eukprot:XP_004259642.1 hypothetical protein EIN_508720 [Entamoeba invadens IP1]
MKVQTEQLNSSDKVSHIKQMSVEESQVSNPSNQPTELSTGKLSHNSKSSDTDKLIEKNHKKTMSRSQMGLPLPNKNFLQNFNVTPDPSQKDQQKRRCGFSTKRLQRNWRNSASSEKVALKDVKKIKYTIC